MMQPQGTLKVSMGRTFSAALFRIAIPAWRMAGIKTEPEIETTDRVTREEIVALFRSDLTLTAARPKPRILSRARRPN
jgi:hypothetical protein